MGAINASEMVGSPSGWYTRLNNVRTNTSKTGTAMGAITVPSSLAVGNVANASTHMNPLLSGIRSSYANTYLRFTKQSGSLPQSVSAGSAIEAIPAIETRIKELEKICANCVDTKDVTSFSTTSHFVQNPNIGAGGFGPVLNPRSDGTPGPANNVQVNSTFTTSHCYNDFTCETFGESCGTCDTISNSTYNFNENSTTTYSTSYATRTLCGDCYTTVTHSKFGNDANCTTMTTTSFSTNTFGYTEQTTSFTTNSTNARRCFTMEYSVGNSDCATTLTFATQFVGYKVQNDK